MIDKYNLMSTSVSPSVGQVWVLFFERPALSAPTNLAFSFFFRMPIGSRVLVY